MKSDKIGLPICQGKAPFRVKSEAAAASNGARPDAEVSALAEFNFGIDIGDEGADRKNQRSSIVAVLAL